MVYLISLLEKFLILYCASDIISQQCNDSHSACCNKNLIREEITVKELLKNFLMDKLIHKSDRSFSQEPFYIILEDVLIMNRLKIDCSKNQG